MKIPQMALCIHFPSSKVLRHICPPIHVAQTPRTRCTLRPRRWLPTTLCGLQVILSGKAHEPTLQKSSEGVGAQLLSNCISEIVVTVTES